MTLLFSSLLLFLAGAAGGALNSVAGGGSFIVFPAILLSGIGPVAANATTTVALWPAGLASAGAYRDHLPRDRRLLVVLALMSAIGGGLGASLLLATSDATFARVLPLLMLAAASIFTFGPRLAKRRTTDEAPLSNLALGAAAVVQLVIATYGGYFGGGMGIMMLATMTLMGMTNLHAMNALKVILGLLINGVAMIGFVLARKFVLAAALPAALGAITGGWVGAALARRIAPARVRAIVLLVAWSLTAWFAYRSWIR